MSTLRVVEGEQKVTVLPEIWGKKVYGIGKASRSILIVGDIMVSQATLLQVRGESRKLDTKETVSVFLGGIGGVLTPPAFRKRGYATQLLEDSLYYMREEWGIVGGILFCLPALLPWYEKRGWKKARGSVLVYQPAEEKMLIPRKISTMVYGVDENVDLVLRSLPW